MLYQVLYSSRAVDEVHEADVASILESARPSNERLGVTGVLIYGDQVFVQLLEGEKQTLDELLERIRRDPRHTDLKVFRREPVEARSLVGWRMACMLPDEAEIGHWLEHPGAIDLTTLAADLEMRADDFPRILLRIVDALTAQHARGESL